MHLKSNVIQLGGHRHKDLTDKGRIVFAYHAFQSGNANEGVKLLSEVSQDYYMSGLYQDLARACLFWSLYVNSRGVNGDQYYKESEYYLIVYRLVKFVIQGGLCFNKSGYFHDIDLKIFKDLPEAT